MGATVTVFKEAVKEKLKSAGQIKLLDDRNGYLFMTVHHDRAKDRQSLIVIPRNEVSEKLEVGKTIQYKPAAGILGFRRKEGDKAVPHSFVEKVSVVGENKILLGLFIQREYMSGHPFARTNP